jgi:hypothetical protein
MGCSVHNIRADKPTTNPGGNLLEKPGALSRHARS